MLTCASLCTLAVVASLTCRHVLSAVENDTAIVGSFVHETRIKAPSDLSAAAATKKGQQQGGGGVAHRDELGDEGYKKTKSIRDKDGYKTFDSYHKKGGDKFGYEQHLEFGKKGGDSLKGGYQQASGHDDDEAAGTTSPKFTEWHFEQKSGSPAMSYRYESGTGDQSKGKLVGPDYEESKDAKESQSSRTKRKKEPHQTAATEYDNYEYADVEEADDPAPADFEAEEGGEPEYEAVYADAADAYDDY